MRVEFRFGGADLCDGNPRLARIGDSRAFEKLACCEGIISGETALLEQIVDRDVGHCAARLPPARKSTSLMVIRKGSPSCRGGGRRFSPTLYLVAVTR